MDQRRSRLEINTVGLHLQSALPEAAARRALGDISPLSRLNTAGQIGEPENGRPRDQAVADHVMADVGSPMLDFLRRAVDSFVKWDIIRFLCENPHTYDTAENITRYAGRSLQATQAELADLAARGVLAEERLDGLVVYSLTDDPATRALALQFSQAAKDQRFRLQSIYYIIRRLR